jgi:major membrane immunogen (membrane-anchored lipoprotein)
MRKLSTVCGALSLLLLTTCGQSDPAKDTDDPRYKAGFEMEKEEGKNEVCQQIEDYKDSMAEALKEADICP